MKSLMGKKGLKNNSVGGTRGNYDEQGERKSDSYNRDFAGGEFFHIGSRVIF